MDEKPREENHQKEVHQYSFCDVLEPETDQLLLMYEVSDCCEDQHQNREGNVPPEGAEQLCVLEDLLRVVSESQNINYSLLDKVIFVVKISLINQQSKNRTKIAGRT